MATDRMYELAFQYKKTKLWKKLSDTDLFAVKLSDGQIGYCCVMGNAGKENVVALYPGTQALQGYQRLLDLALNGCQTEAELQDIFLSQNCLQCAFDTKDNLRQDELDEVRAYIKKHGITLRGANAFPQFIKFQPYYHPWYISSELEQLYICEALEACIAMANLLEKQNKWELGFSNHLPSDRTIPCLVKEGDGYTLSSTHLPAEIPPEYPSPVMKDEITTARLKKAKKKGALQCRIIYLPVPIQDAEDMVPYYPALLAAANASTGEIYPMESARYLEEHPEDFLNHFAQTLLMAEICPKTIYTNDQRTFEMLKHLCGAAGIQLTLTAETLPALEEAIEFITSTMLPESESDEMEEESLIFEAFDLIMNLSDKELKQLPKDMILQMLELAEVGLIPPEIEFKLRRALRK